LNQNGRALPPASAWLLNLRRISPGTPTIPAAPVKEVLTAGIVALPRLTAKTVASDVATTVGVIPQLAVMPQQLLL